MIQGNQLTVSLVDMEHICMIVDLDGYRIRSGFIARELGVYSLKDGTSQLDV